MIDSSVTIRAAGIDDRDDLIRLLDRAFAQEPGTGRHLRLYPHLFTEARIGDHHLAVAADGRLLACVGCYPFAASLHGRPLRVAGIGQVGTDPEARGRGLMSRLLSAALAAQETADLFFLYGDRQRYGRVGFAPGGRFVSAHSDHRYCPPPASGAPIRALDLAVDAARIEAVLAALPCVLQQDAGERRTMLAGKDTCGWTDGEATILVSGDRGTVWAQHGETAAVIRLIAHHLRHGLGERSPDTGLTILADPADAASLAVLRAVAGSLSTRPTACLRVGHLAPLLRLWATIRPPPPGARLRSAVLAPEGGAAVTIACREGAWAITTDARSPVGATILPLAGAALAELVFGLLPLAVWDVPDDSVLHHLLPLHFAIPVGYGL